MIDRIEIFKNFASENDLTIDLAKPLNQSTDEELLKDRELIEDFMGHAGETQRLLLICESSNN